MRIISGFLKGKKVEGYHIDGTRPTMDRVKESVFGSIQNVVPSSVVLDLFAGSGSLGLEAISNGAGKAYFVDNNKEVIRTLKKTVSDFSILNKCVLLEKDYKEAISYFVKNDIKFDIVFLDPPYKMECIEEILETITKEKILTKNAVVVCEYQKDKLKENYGNLQLVKSKKYGDKFVNIYYMKNED